MIARLLIRTMLTICLAVPTSAIGAADETGDYTRLDLSDMSTGFTSPGNAYGPWNIQDARLVFVQSGKGAINLEFAHQNDGDAIYPTHGEFFGAGITRDLTSRLYVYGNFGYGTANPYAKTDVHLEADYKTTPDLKLVLAGSEDIVSYYSGTSLQELSLGPTYYFDHGDLTVHYLVAANSNATTQSGVLASADYIPNLRSKYTVTGLFGPQSYEVLIPRIPLTLQNVSGQTYTFSTEQQLGRTDSSGRRWGLTVGVFISQLNQATGGSLLYVARGLNVGFWTTQ